MKRPEKFTLYPKSVTDRGFTLIEAIVVIVVVGILSSVAIVRYSSSDSNQIMGVANRILSDIAYTQELAVLEHRGTKVIFIYGGITPPPRRCFVASVCYGENASQTNTLRALRDQFLMKFEEGRKFIDWYYIYGPKIADFIEDLPPIRVAVKLGIMPVVIISKLFVTDAHAGGGGGGGGGEEPESGEPNTYSLEYQSGGFIKDPVGLVNYIIDLGDRVTITSSNLTLEFDSSGKMTIPNYNWTSGQTSMVAVTLNSSVNIRVSKHIGKAWIEN